MRSFLQKTWLPLKKKRDAFLGRIRLSMSLRITLNYLKLMVVNGVVFMGVFLVLYLNVQTEEYKNLADRVTSVVLDVAAAQSGAAIGKYIGKGQQDAEEKIISDDVNQAGGGSGQLSEAELFAKESFSAWLATVGENLNPFTGRGVSLIIQEKDNRKLLYDDTRFEVKGFLFFKDLHVDLSDREHHIIINSRHAFSIGRTGFELIYSYNISKDYNRMWKLILNMSFLYAVIVFFILHEARGQNVRMLIPIKEMSDTINRITVNNLHSERLNPSGVTDELR